MVPGSAPVRQSMTAPSAGLVTVSRTQPGAASSTLPLQSSSRPLHISAVGCCVWRQCGAPDRQVVLPAAQTPGRPVLHAAPAPGFPSSTVPSQSSSRPLHISLEAWTFGAQISDPPEQVRVPAAQTPEIPVAQAAPPPGFPSSAAPSQSSSMPLHVSAEGAPGLHVCGEPPRQFCAVTRQAPVPQVVLPSPSSATPSQFSSRPLHTSVAGEALGAQISDPPEHVRVPEAHLPGSPVEQAAPPPGLPSSTVPSQSSSMPLQLSADGTPGLHVSGRRTPPTHAIVPVE